MSKFTDLKEKAKELGIRVPVGTSLVRLEKIIEDATKPAEGKLTPPAKKTEPENSEDSEDRLKAPDEPTNEISVEDDAPPGVKKGDYLWRYEIDKNTGYPHFKARTIPFDPPWQYRQPDRGRAIERKRMLLGQPKVIYIVPKADGDSGDSYATVNINGYRLDFPKNEAIELPKQVVDILMDSYKQTQKALHTGLYENAKGIRM